MNSLIRRASSRIPILKTLREYDREMFSGDLVAGVTVAIMLVPQGMAYAVLAGMPPVYGLYASVVPLLLYAILGTSRQLAVGPVAMVSILVLAGVSELAVAGSDRFIQLAILTAFGVGLIQLLMGLFKLGFLVNFLSHPVLSGFTSAAAVIIGASQIRNLTGLEMDRASGLLEMFSRLVFSFDEIHLATALIGIGSILVMVSVRKWRPSFPSALLAVAAGIAVTFLFQLEASGVSIVGDVPKGLPRLDAGFFRMADFQALIPLILVISLVSYMESIAVAKAIANRRGYRVDPDQELIALGSANLGGAFFQSFPTTGGFSRTAVNDQSGAHTTVASVITAVLIGFTVLFLTPLFTYLPQAVLAAVIMVAVAGLFDAAEMVHLWKTDRRDLAMLLVTFFATLFLGIEEGILTGVFLSLVMVIYSSTRPHHAELGRLGGSHTFRNIERYEEALTEEDVLIFRFDSALYFANVAFFRESLDEKIRRRGEELKLVILDASAMPSIDSTGMAALEELIRGLESREVGFFLAGVLGPVRDKLQTCGVIDKLGRDHFFFDVAEALEEYRKSGGERRERTYSPLQTNL